MYKVKEEEKCQQKSDPMNDQKLDTILLSACELMPKTKILTP